MGLLDDAIREHLDLKRRRGADPAEVERAEREALGPVRRGPEAPESVEPGLEDPLASDHEAEEDWAEPYDEAGNGFALQESAHPEPFDEAEPHFADEPPPPRAAEPPPFDEFEEPPPAAQPPPFDEFEPPPRAPPHTPRHTPRQNLRRRTSTRAARPSSTRSKQRSSRRSARSTEKTSSR